MDLQLRALALALLTLASPLVPAAADPVRTVQGRVDGQKYGTNILGDGLSVNFPGDSAEESRLLDACAVGQTCRVVVVTGPGDVVKQLISAKAVATPGATGAFRSGPSFSCEKATTKVGQLICTDAGLSSLDLQPALQYRRLMQSHADRRDPIAQQQHQWIRDVRAHCEDAACLRAAYVERIAALTP